MAKKELQALVAEQKILNKIYAIRGERVMIDQVPCRDVRRRNKTIKKAGKA